ncbi:MAG: InlB B-repeat-containing protein [Treponema sp.]|nr:InlB B-repeat-containing protein [Treponema sp.]
MKMLKTNLFNNIFKAASLLVCAALVACSGVNGVSDRDESSSSNNGRAYLSSISFGNGRTILPNSSFDLATSIDRFVLRGTALDAEEPAEVELGTWDTSDAGSAYTLMLADISRNTIELTAGSWNFTVTAFVKSGENYVPVLQKSIEEQQVRSGGNRLNFGTLAEANGNGKLRVTLNYPADTGLYTVERVTAALEALPGTNWSSTGETQLTPTSAGTYKSVSHTADPANGNYILKIKFYIRKNDGTTVTQYYTELVRIATGLESSATRTINDLMSLYSITYTLNGGSQNSNLQGTYSPYDGDVALATSPVVSKTGATFAGWYESSSYSGSRLSSIAAGTTGNKTLFAKWGYEMNASTKTISANGASLIVQAEGKTTRIYFDEDGDGVCDADEVILGDNGQPMDFTGWTVYGGSQSGNYSGATDVTVNSGNLNAVYGGNGTGSVSNTSVEINGGTIGTVYGGSNTGSVSGSSVVDVNGGYVENVYGAGKSGTTGSSTVNVTGGKVENVGGGSNGGTVTGNATINISGGEVVYAAGDKNHVDGISSVNINGNVNIGDVDLEKGIDIDTFDGGVVTATDDVSGNVEIVTKDGTKLDTGSVIVLAEDDVEIAPHTISVTNTETHETVSDIGKGADGNFSVGRGPLSGIVMNQYGPTDSESGSNPFNITSTFKPYTTDYSGLNLQTSVNYMGKILVTPTWNSEIFSSITSVRLTGTLNAETDFSHQNAVRVESVPFDSNGGCKISVFTYANYSEIVLTYVVNTKDGRTVTYTFPITVSQLEGLSADATINVEGTDYTTVNGDYPNMIAFVIRDGKLDFVGRVNGGNMLQTTYQYQGWRYVLYDGMNRRDLNLVDNGNGTATAIDSSTGITLTVAIEITMSGDTPYLKLTHTLDTKGKTVKLGAWTDTMVGDNDYVPIECKTWGYYLDGDIKLSLYLRNSLDVDDVNGWWYGDWYNAETNVFSTANMTARLNGKDSGAAFHWNNLNGTVTKTIRMSLSDHVD